MKHHTNSMGALCIIAAITNIFVAYTASRSVLTAIGMGSWVTLPYCLAYAAYEWLDHRNTKAILTALSWLMFLYVSYDYYDLFFVHIDALNGLVLMFYPLAQFVMLAVVTVILKLVDKYVITKIS